MAFTLFTTLFTHVDAATTTFATDVSSRAINAALPVITVGLTLSFIFYGLLVARGAVDDSLKDFFFKCLKIGIIVSIATTGGLYQTQIANAIQQTPNEFAMALLPNSAGQAQGQTAATIVDSAAEVGFTKAGDAFQKSTIFTQAGMALTAFGVLLVVSTAVLTAVGGAFILLAKIALALLAALGPLFIFALIFKSTARFFEAWAGQVLTYGLLVILVSAIFGFVMQMFTSYMSGITFGTTGFAATLGGCVILCVASLMIIIQLPTIAGALASGVGLGLWSELRMARNAGSAGASGAASGAIGASKFVGRTMGVSSPTNTSAAEKSLGRFRGSGRNGI